MTARHAWLALLGGLLVLAPPVSPLQAAPPSPRPAGVPTVAITEIVLPRADSAPTGITNGPDGNLWFTEQTADQIGRSTSAGAIAEFPLPTAHAEPSAIAAGPDGNLWFTEPPVGRIGRITPDGRVTEFLLPTQQSHPEGLNAGPDGNVWFTEFSAGRIGRVTPSGAITEFPLPTADRGPVGITAGPDGNLWFTESAAGQVGRITPAGAITEFPLPDKTSAPGGIVAGPDGALWVAENTGNRVAQVSAAGHVLAEYPLPDPGSVPAELTVGPDGNLWLPVTPGYINLIARMTLTGTVTQYSLPTEVAVPVGITSGPDGNVWFTESAAGRLGRISEIGYGAHCPVHYGDVPPSSPFYAPVLCLACHGMLAGYADGTFRPGANITRGQLAKLLSNAADYGEPVPVGYQTFADVPAAQPFYLYVERAAAHFALHGYGCGVPGEPCDPAGRPYFRPAAPVARGQAAQAVANAARYSDVIPPGQQTFRDVPPTSQWWLAVERGVRHGVLSGYGDGTYRPGGLVTRGQMAKLLANAFLPGCVPPGP